MKRLTWNEDKAAALLKDSTRGNVSFEDCVVAMENGDILAIVDNPSQNHKGQQMYVLSIRGYAYCVPFVESEAEVFLKTVFPSRKYTELFLLEGKP